MAYVTVTRDSEDGLSRKEWRFYLISDGPGVRIVLHEYENMTRPTTRHRKWKVIGGFGVHDPISGRTRKDPVPLPEDVTSEAVNQFCGLVSEAMIRFVANFQPKQGGGT